MGRRRSAWAAVAVAAVVAAGLAVTGSPAGAATVTVCPSGCDHTGVGAAVAAASSGDTITIAAGTYAEPAPIVVDKALTILGAGSGATIIDGGATPVADPGQLQLRTGSGEDVHVEGLTIRNPVTAGSTYGVLAKSTDTPGPAYVLRDVAIEGNGAGDEYGIYTDNSTASLTFEDGSISGTHYNPVLVEQPRAATSFVGNVIARGTFCCGYFNMTSNPNKDGASATAPQVVAGNTFTGGANVTFFADFLQDGGGGYASVDVSDNTFEAITGGGITLHNNAADDGAHAAFGSVVVSGNRIEGAGGTSRGVRFHGAGSTATVVGNDLTGLGSGVQVQPAAAGHEPSSVTVTGNRIVGNGVGVSNTTASPVAGQHNWWGCNAGPGAAGCDSATGAVDADPWLVLDLQGPASVTWPSTAGFTASVDQASAGPAPAPPFPGGAVAFAATGGTVTPSAALSAGEAAATFTPDAFNGPASVSATYDNETVTVATEVVGVPLRPTKLTATPMVVEALPDLRIRLGGVDARLTNADSGAPIPGKLVRFSSGGTFLCEAITDGNGDAECGFGLTGILAGVLDFGYVAVFDGDANHEPAGGIGAGRAPLIRIGGLRLF